MKKPRTLIIICLFVVVLNVVSYAQTDNGTGKIKYNTWSVTLSGGSMLFYGDLRQFDSYLISAQNGKDWFGFTTDISERNMGFGLAVSKQLTSVFGVQGELQKGKLGGVKRSVDAYFTADVLKCGINGTVNFKNLFFPNCKNHSISVYGIAGLGYLDFKTVEKTISTDAEIMSYGYGNNEQKKKQTTELAFPFGLGLKYKIFPKLDLGVECILNNINTDKLDALVRANTAKDKYSYTAITLTYQIGKNEKSLEWVNPKIMKSDELTPLLAAINKKIDSLGSKLNEIDSKVGALQKDVAILKNPPKEADDDDDGVPNIKDLEPDTPKGNLVDARGRSLPESKVVVDTVISRSEILFSIYFDFNSAEIKPEHQIKIVEAVKKLKADPNIKLNIVGHADKVGGAEYNQTLSGKRIQAIVDVLIKSYGIDISRIIKTPLGKTDPLSLTDDAINRRVDFFIVKE